VVSGRGTPIASRPEMRSVSVVLALAAACTACTLASTAPNDAATTNDAEDQAQIQPACTLSVSAFCAQGPMATDVFGTTCQANLTVALEEARAAICGNSNDVFYGYTLAKNCSGFDVLRSYSIDTGTTEYFDTGTGALVAVAIDGNAGAFCAGGPSDFVVPTCSALSYVDICPPADGGGADAAQSDNANAAVGNAGRRDAGLADASGRDAWP
jgi:hypothetical protein